MITQTVKILSLSQYWYSDISFNTNLNIQDKVWWQFCDLKPLHKVLFVCLVLFLSLCIKFLQQGVQVYLKQKEIQKFWVLHLHTVLPRMPSTNTVLTVWHLILYTMFKTLNVIYLWLFLCSTYLTFRHRASCILEQAFQYSPENTFYIFNQQIYFII